MTWFPMACQLALAAGLLNVWLLRTGRSSPWRGGDAATMREEFAVYGLPSWAWAVVGFLKISLALLLIAGVRVPVLARPAALGVTVLMLGAMAMHLKVGDPARKSLPAAALLVLSLIVAFA